VEVTYSQLGEKSLKVELTGHGSRQANHQDSPEEPGRELPQVVPLPNDRPNRKHKARFSDITVTVEPDDNPDRAHRYWFRDYSDHRMFMRVSSISRHGQSAPLRRIQLARVDSEDKKNIPVSELYNSRWLKDLVLRPQEFKIVNGEWNRYVAKVSRSTVI
jgi:hypothetical protein